jgi:hypothetical protein
METNTSAERAGQLPRNGLFQGFIVHNPPTDQAPSLTLMWRGPQD